MTAHPRIHAIHETGTDELSARLEGIRALDAMDKRTMLDASRSAYEAARIDASEARAAIAGYDAEIRVIAERRQTELDRRDNANLTIKRSLEVIAVLEDELA